MHAYEKPFLKSVSNENKSDNANKVTQSFKTRKAQFPPENGKKFAMASLILAIISYFGPILLTAIPAIIFSHIASNKLKGLHEAGSEGMAKAGLILGYINVLLSILLFLVLLI